MSKSFEFDISISADKQRRQKNLRRKSGAVETSSKTCDHPKCNCPGLYRAPKSASQLDDYYWFCEQHVREYNSKWNFFEDPGEELKIDVEKKSYVGSVEEQRKVRKQKAWQRHGINDPLELLGSKGTIRKENGDSILARLTADERRAVQILDVEASWSKAKIRQQYKSLVKIYHPDQNGGFRDEEDRLQMVLWAWNKINKSKHFSK